MANEASLPDAVQNLLYVGAVLGATIGGLIYGKKRKGDDPKGEGVVVAGSFMERQAVIDLTISVRNLDGSVRQMLALLEDMHRERELEREVQIQLLKKKGEI